MTHCSRNLLDVKLGEHIPEVAYTDSTVPRRVIDLHQTFQLSVVSAKLMARKLDQVLINPVRTKTKMSIFP